MTEAAGSGLAGPARGNRRARYRVDIAIAVCAGIATVLVHPVSQMLSRPYWVDEAWVADLTRASWSRMVAVGSPTPVGFIALAKLVPGSGQQHARLLTLGFSVLGVVVAYVLARGLAWESRLVGRLAGAATAFAVMMAPLSLVRNDLKQYTCDAFCALAIFAIGVITDRHDHVSLWWLVGASAIAVIFSSTSAFVSAAMFAGLLAAAVLQRTGRRVRDVLVAGGVAAAILAGYLLLVVQPKLSSGLKAYWAADYLHGSPLHVLSVSWTRLDDLAPHIAMPAVVFVALFLAGVYELVRLRASAVAVAVPLLWIEMMIVAVLQKYPFLQLRTSQFLLVSSLAVVAIGAVGLVRAAGARVHIAGAVALALIFGALFTAGSVKYVHRLGIAPEDVRSQTEYVAEHRRSRDVILVNDSANFGFSYYWPHGHVVLHRDSSGAGFRASVAGVDAVFARDRTDAAVRDALREALDRWRSRGAGARLFIVRTHLHPVEVTAWKRAFTALGVKPVRVRVGGEPLLVLEPGP